MSLPRTRCTRAQALVPLGKINTIDGIGIEIMSLDIAPKGN